jgi:hypothetical protein
VPIAKIANIRPGGHAIDGAPALRNFLLTHTHRDQRQPRPQLNPNLE